MTKERHTTPGTTAASRRQDFGFLGQGMGQEFHEARAQSSWQILWYDRLSLSPLLRVRFNPGCQRFALLSHDVKPKPFYLAFGGHLGQVRQKLRRPQA